MTLTKSDLSNIEQIVDRKLEEKLEDKLEEKLEEKLGNLKSEFFDRIDPILQEVVTAREERPLIISRLESLEKIHQKGSQSLSN